MPNPTTPQDLIRLVQEGRRRTCPHCQHDNPTTTTFCASCGQRLQFPCPRCDATCYADNAFCGHCGVALAEAVRAHLEALDAREEADRRAREADLLRQYRDLRTVEDGRLTHMLGVAPDGAEHFVKVARDATARRLMANEVEALEALAGLPGVQPIAAEFADKRHHVIAFDRLDGLSLRFPVAIPELLQLTVALLDILDGVHDRGWVHCDLKPAHLMRGPGDDGLCLVDFNIAQPPGPSRFGAYTALFAAPEQIVGDHLDHRVDLHAVGVMLYMLFTYDRFPAVLEERSESQAHIGVLKARPAKNRAFLSSHTQYVGKVKAPPMEGGLPAAPLNPELERRRVLGAKYLFNAELRRTCDVNTEIRLTGAVMEVVRTACAVDPEARYANAAEMRDALAAILTEAGEAR